MNILAPGIALFDDVIKNPEDLINNINYHCDINILHWEQSHVYGPDGLPMIDKKNRDCSSIDIQSCFPDDFAPRSEHELITSVISNAFKKNFTPLLEEYFKRFTVPKITSYDQYIILKYGKDQKFDAHVDDGENCLRRVSLTWYANDDYIGGEIEFPEFNLTIKPKKNQMIIFPSNYVYLHKVHPVISGTRYAVVQWMR
jgi:hypothetical protein